MKKPLQHLPAQVMMCGKLITSICEERLGISGKSLRAKGRYHHLIAARASCYFLLHTINDFKLIDIASYFDRDHASIIHGLSTHQQLYLSDFKNYRSTFKQLEEAYKFKLADLEPNEEASHMTQIIRLDQMIKDLERTRSFIMRMAINSESISYEEKD